MELREEIGRKAYLTAMRTMDKRTENADMRYEIWDWQAGVGMYGLFRYWERTHEESVLPFLKEYADHHIRKGLGERTINTVAPVNLLLDLYLGGERRYKPIIEQYVDFCRYRAERTGDGVLVHSVIGKSFSHQIWSDTLFMGVLLMSRWASITGDEDLMDDAVHQLTAHYRYLTDPDSGLLFHGYEETTGSHLSGVRWGRANGWALVTAPTMLLLMPQRSAGYDAITEAYLRHLDAVLGCMRTDGTFTTVLDDPDSPKEMTVSSCVCYSIRLGRELGILDRSYDRYHVRALGRLLEAIDEEGNVLGCSGGTPIMESAAAYRSIPDVVSYYGQGLALLALSSIL